MQLRKQHDIETNGDLEQSEENINDDEESGNSSESNASTPGKPECPSGGGDDSMIIADVITDVSFGDSPNLNPDTSEGKPSKSIKVIYFWISVIDKSFVSLLIAGRE